MAGKYLQRKCPSCENASVDKIEISSAVPAETLEFSSLGPIWNGFFKEKSFFSYSRCNQCKILYAPKFFTPDQLTELYSQMSPNMDIVPFDMLRQTQRGYFDFLKAQSPLKGDFIEIGPDVGLFAENCVQQGGFEHYWLFEPNKAVENKLKETMGSADHTILHDMFDFSMVPDHKAGAVVMVHVLDHLLEPVATLKTLRQKMAPDSVLVVVTHDESSLLARFLKNRWPAFCLQHPQLFNPSSIKGLMQEAGFQVSKTAKTTNNFPVSFLLRHLLWALGIKVQNVPSFFGLSVGLRLGNIITIATPA